MSTKNLREQRARLIQQARDVLDAATNEGRVLNEEEQQKWDGFMSEADQLKATFERIERLEDEERALAESQGRKTEEQRGGGAPERRAPVSPQATDRGDALRGWLMQGTNESPPDSLRSAAQRVGLDVNNKLLSFNLATTALRSLDRDDIREWEQRAQSVGTTTAGGYTVPDDVMRELEVALLRYGGMREVASILRTSSGAALPWPTVNDTTQKGAILAENAQVAQQDLVFGQLVLDAYKYSSKMILVPVELLQDSAINVAAEIGSALGIRIARITNEHFTVGTGTSQPNGVVTASAVGKTGATGQTTSVTYADLVDLEHSVDPEYRRNARFMFADSTLKALKKLLDGQNRPLWAPGIAVREPDTILGYPYVINQDMPVMAANAKSIVFGDLSKYKIRDVQEVVLRRLDERFADFHQVAFLAFSRHDGDLLNAGTNPVKHYANSAT